MRKRDAEIIPNNQDSSKTREDRVRKSGPAGEGFREGVVWFLLGSRVVLKLFNTPSSPVGAADVFWSKMATWAMPKTVFFLIGHKSIENSRKSSHGQKRVKKGVTSILRREVSVPQGWQASRAVDWKKDPLTIRPFKEDPDTPLGRRPGEFGNTRIGFWPDKSSNVRPWAFRAASWAWCGSGRSNKSETHFSNLGPPKYIFYIFGSYLRFELPFWRPLDFVGGHKIDMFWIQSTIKCEEMKTRRGCTKNTKLLWMFYANTRGPEG